MCSSFDRPTDHWKVKSEKKQSWIIFMTGNFFSLWILGTVCFTVAFSYIFSLIKCCWLITIQRKKTVHLWKKPVPLLIYVLFHLSIEIFAHYFIHISHLAWCVLFTYSVTLKHLSKWYEFYCIHLSKFQRIWFMCVCLWDCQVSERERRVRTPS